MALEGKKNILSRSSETKHQETKQQNTKNKNQHTHKKQTPTQTTKQWRDSYQFRGKLASRVLFLRPAHYVPETILQQHVRERTFPDRRAEGHQILTWLFFRRNAMSYGSWLQGRKGEPCLLCNWEQLEWFLRADKQDHLEYTTKSDIVSFLSSPPLTFFGSLVNPCFLVHWLMHSSLLAPFRC